MNLKLLTLTALTGVIYYLWRCTKAVLVKGEYLSALAIYIPLPWSDLNLSAIVIGNGPASKSLKLRERVLLRLFTDLEVIHDMVRWPKVIFHTGGSLWGYRLRDMRQINPTP